MVLICACTAQEGFAQGGSIDDNDLVGRLTGSTLFQGATDARTFVPGLEQSHTIKNVITLSLIEETSHFLSSNFSATVKIKIEYGHSSASVNTINEQILTITYNKDDGAKYNAKNYFHFSDAEYVKITVNEITPATVGSINMQDILLLENKMMVTRYYDLSSNTAQLQPTFLSRISPAPGADELLVGWQWQPEARNTHTQLEWTWVEDELITSYYVNGSLDNNLLFKNNSTRIDLPVSSTVYKIPLLYGGQGKIYFRLRAVNSNKSGARADGPWSSVQSESFVGHNELLNWQSTISFAEDGKRKGVMQYYDGSLRNRQTVTKENVNNTTVSAETFYDRQGRPAIQILPAPGINNVIAYTKNLNLFNGQAEGEDPASFFDLEPIATPNSLTPALNKNYGTAKYYSDANPEKNSGANGNIPDAEGYPYAVTRYTPDGTGRIMAQSGVGAAMKMGSTHETKYYYGTPSQEELDGLFGTEVGNFTHYFKNMVKDANGQMSVSYVDMHGRTIATALAGDAPANMVALDMNEYSNQSVNSIQRNLLDNNSNVVKNNSIEAINTLLVPAATLYQFRYELNPEILQLTSCTSTPICYDCMYDLEISITDESGDVGPIVKRYNNINLNADDNCGTGVQGFKNEAGVPIPNNVIMFDTTLSAGSYSIRKMLTISEASLQKYKDEYLQQALCKTEQQLIDSVYNVMFSVSGCDNPPPASTCDACNTALGTPAAYRTNYLNSIGNPSPVPPSVDSAINAGYNAAKQNCDKLCNTVSQSLPTKRQLMLADMIPYSGQYAKETVTGTTMYNKYDIFSTVNAGQPFYKKPWKTDQSLGYYYTPLNVIDPTVHPGTPADQTVFLNSLSKDDYVQLFNTKWAEALLPHHPEYPKLQFAENNLTTSYNWINSFSNTGNYTQASGSNYIFTAEASINDPFYTVAPSYKSAMAVMINTNYRQNLSMWQIAYGDAKCKNILAPGQRDACYQAAPKTPPYNDLTATEKDQVWKMFRSLYAMERDIQVNNYITANVALADAQTLVDQGYILHFPTSQQMLAQQNTNNGNDWSWWPATAGGPPNLNNFPGGTTAAQTYSSRCSGYIELWKQSLLQCETIKNHASKDQILTQITSAMALVCEKGSNQANPYGSSNVAPATPNDGSPRSFEEVINSVFSQYGISRDSLCNPFVIEFPKPYGKGPVFTKEITTTIDTCHCSRLTQLKIEAGSAGNSFTTFNQYLQAQYSDTLTWALYDGMMQNCSRLKSLACIGPCEDRKCDSTGTIYTLPVAQPLPEFLKCGFTGSARCLDCAQLSSLTAEFKTQFTSPYNAGPVFTVGDLTPTNTRDNILYAKFINYRTGFQFGWIDYAKAAATASPNCNLANYAGNGNAHQNVICGNTKPLTDTTGIFVTDPPCKKVYTMAVALAQQIYQQRKETLLADFEAAYRAKCMAAKNIETFKVTYNNKEYHYTLYYYDQAGSLVKTVPPKGVRPDWSTTNLNNVKTSRANNYNANWPRPHVLVTNYRYNSLGQVVAQNTPDASKSFFWYDRLGRLVVSQNAQQLLNDNIKKYSYTLYDELGRIKEVGQKPQSTQMTQTISQDETALYSWIVTNGGVREQITQTKYDLPHGMDAVPPIDILTGLVTQKNLRNRVSYTMVLPLASDPEAYHAGTFYSYDIHGNVDTLVQHYKGVAEAGVADKFKRITYDYDLISGKVNEVSYQPGKDDAFYHRYSYDAENRLTGVETSRDKILWEEDARYSYYKHGPLARTVLGKLQVQGIDYAYTLQGWLKGVNSTNLDPSTDIGKDGLNTGTLPPVARDVVGFSLHYYDDGSNQLDYKTIAGTSAFARPGTNSNFVSLYNGNIGAISINNAGLLKGPPASTNALPLFYNYRYDQLNRIVSMQAYKGLDAATNQWNAIAIDDYKEAITYDPNGNILTYNRKGSPSIVGKQTEMDDLGYNYYANTNQLKQVTDNPAYDGYYTEDINNQTNANNYTYDAIGNLKTDVSEGITGIVWNVYGKIASITKSSGTIYYTYDASGNRITKTANGKTTLYARDASGNVMSVYEAPAATTNIKQIETHLFGSSRLGIAMEQTVAPATKNLTGGFAAATISVFTRSEKVFELSNHLGNVLLTVSDKKIGVDNTSDGNVDYYNADVITATDYAPFGMTMSGRKYNNSSYRYGFNGKENDNDVKGEGNQQDYGMRIYDPRIGRFLSVDPLMQKYPWYTPYQFAGNRPIIAIDVDGLEPHDVNTHELKKELTPGAAEHKASNDPIAHGSDAKPWKDLVNFRIPDNLKKELGDREIGEEQTIEGAWGSQTNLDYYTVQITKLPDGIKNGGELLEAIRLNLGQFLDGKTTFAGYNSSGSDTKKWQSDNPLGAVMSFDAEFEDPVFGTKWNLDDASVMTSSYYKNSDGGFWTFSTLHTVGDGFHPIGGTRQFGVSSTTINGVTSYTFYIRAADRAYDAATNIFGGQTRVFKSAEVTWNAVCSSIFMYVNNKGGKAFFPSTPISKRVSWDSVEEQTKDK